MTMDEEMLDRMAHLDRTAVAKNANRLIQAKEPRCGSQSTDALRRAGERAVQQPARGAAGGGTWGVEREAGSAMRLFTEVAFALPL